MLNKSSYVVRAAGCLFAAFALVSLELSAQVPVVIQTNVTLRVMAANLTSGNNQRYESPGLDILKGLKPDIVALQEFNYASTNGRGINTPAAIREMIDATFGTNFVYFRETNSGYAIPNGIVSRFPMLAGGSWVDSDTGVNDRGFAWAQIDLPGTNDLYVVSVHLKASSGSSNESRRAAEAAEVSSLIQSNFPSNAWIIVAGDMNLHSEAEAAITTFRSFLGDSPVPTDASAGGNPNTNEGRTERYDRVLASFSLTNSLVPVAMPSQTFPNGLVFDSRVYTPLKDVAPVLVTDSGTNGMQHMGVVKDFEISYSITNYLTVPAPHLALRSPTVIVWQGLSNLIYTVQAKTNLSQPNWSTIGTVASSNGFFTFTNQNGSATQTFFRVRYP